MHKVAEVYSEKGKGNKYKENNLQFAISILDLNPEQIHSMSSFNYLDSGIEREGKKGLKAFN